MDFIQLEHINHFFSNKEKVLDDVSISVPEGAVYGFLGPNGAGKTTTLRLLLGLLKKQKGSISIFGKAIDVDRESILKDVGSLIEMPSLYGHLTAEENLRIYQKIFNCSKSRIQVVLEIVGLSNTGKKKTSKFSLGMKQRLGIAISILHNPKLLILDEPTNGLDPNGMVEIRDLVKKLNQEMGITIIISSHLLAEIEKIVSHIGVIHQGKILFEGTLQELKAQQARQNRISFEVNRLDLAEQIFKECGIDVMVSDTALQIAPISNQEIALLNKALIQSEVEVYRIFEEKNDLEGIFMDLIQDKK
jgi:lantibiotic transport system ATP-binding protein